MYDLNDIRYFLKIEKKQKRATTADAIEYVRNHCKNCYAERVKCKKCDYHNLMENHIKKRLFEPFVYRNLHEYGNCYIAQSVPLSEEQIFDLKVFGFPKVEFRKSSIGGLIISVVR